MGDGGPAKGPGVWIPEKNWKPENKWTPGKPKEDPCPCKWQSIPTHLTKCNWKSCGPGPPSGGDLIPLSRLKGPDDWVSEYQSEVVVGGGKMWMTLESGVATTWVVSMACYAMTGGCKETKLFAGMFIPFIPPGMVQIDMFSRGLLGLGAISGILGHSLVVLGSSAIVGAPIAMGILDMGILGSDSFNHTGAIGLGFWEENMPDWLTQKDPALSVGQFMMTGNIFFPIPSVIPPIMKPFELWGIPFFFPSGMLTDWAFFFADRGGCFYSNGHPTKHGEGSISWIQVIPVAVKLVSPSWLFVMSDAKVDGLSVNPCEFGACKATIHTGVFAITGPLAPMMKIVEQCSAPKTCEEIEILPDVSWTLSGSELTMTRHHYVIHSEAYGELECLTAFTPEVQFIPAFAMWIFGDAFIHAFYAMFEAMPMKRVGLQVADYRSYEKNGCPGKGEGPFQKHKKLEDEEARHEAERKKAIHNKRKEATDLQMGRKRYENWMDDLKGMKRNVEARKRDEALGPPFGSCGSGFRFKNGDCVKAKHANEVERLLSVYRQDMFSRTQSQKPEHQPPVADENGPKIVPLRRSRRRSKRTQDVELSGTAQYLEEDDEDDYELDVGEEILLEEKEASAGGSATSQQSNPKPRFKSRLKMSSPRAQELADFHASKDYTFNLHRDAFAKAAKSDRIKNGVEPEWSSMRFTSKRGGVKKYNQITLPKDAVQGEEAKKDVQRNMSMLMYSWREELNITDKPLVGYWRGESQDFIDDERKVYMCVSVCVCVGVIDVERVRVV